MSKAAYLRVVAGAVVAMSLQIVPVHGQEATVPFGKLLCLSTFGSCTTSVAGVLTPPLPGFFVVPTSIGAGLSVSRLVIDFVSGDCIGTGRTTEVFIYGVLGDLKIGAKGDNFSSNRIPLSVAQFNDTLNVNAVQSFAARTQLTYRPNTRISMSFDFAKGGDLVCKLQLNGHYVTR
jgi:hypothetical protein